MEPAAATEFELERLRAQVAALSKDAVLAQLAAGVIHEINTPIASIFSNIDVMERSLEAIEAQLGAGGPPKALALLKMMRNLVQVDRMACQRISGVIRGLKLHARGEEEGLCPAHLNQLVEDSILLVGSEYKRRIAFITDLGDLPPVECNPQLIGQALLNLLVNAAQAIEAEGQVTVRTAVEGDQVLISIADTGTGMTDEVKQKIFHTAFSTKALGVGTGLGLPLTYRIITEQHRGTITFTSELGRGTTFEIRIPITTKEP
ncbi:MAG: ATP-binding protein [Acidobacteria bacterium]|nr:ATP-binding protein [Acidobacteriota bacterium]